MDQPVYSNFPAIRLVPQQVSDESHQQQNFIMSDDSQNHQIVYSPVKSNELTQMQPQQHQAQFISQDDSMGGQYLIQQTSTPQQVFYTNISTPNQNANRIVQQTSFIQQQNQPKVTFTTH